MQMNNVDTSKYRYNRKSQISVSFICFVRVINDLLTKTLQKERSVYHVCVIANALLQAACIIAEINLFIRNISMDHICFSRRDMLLSVRAEHIIAAYLYENIAV